MLAFFICGCCKKKIKKNNKDIFYYIFYKTIKEGKQTI